MVGDAIEKIRKDEENVVTVQVREDMTREEVMELVYQRVDQELPLKEDVTSSTCNILMFLSVLGLGVEGIKYRI